MFRQVFALGICRNRNASPYRIPSVWCDAVRPASSKKEKGAKKKSKDLKPVKETLNESQVSADTFGTLAPSMVKKQTKKYSKKSELQRTVVQSYKELQAIKNVRTLLSDDKNALESLSQNEDWKETFGTLAQSEMKSLELQMQAEEEDAADPDHRPLRRVGRNTANWYGMQIEKLAKEGKIYEAIEMFEVKMLKEDRVHPTRYTFTTLIGILGRAGYTKKAFQLYNQMKKFGLEPQSHTYTALFNSCANSPYPEDALQRANKLRQQLTDRGVVLHIVTYRAMIKAYGKLGELETAFQIVDELVENRHRLDGHVFQHLLVATISDKEAGCTHAIQVWRRMRKRGIIPETGHYNLLLRAARDCGMGDATTMEVLLSRKEQSTDSPQLLSGSENVDGQIDQERLLQIEPISVKDEESAGKSEAVIKESPPESKSWWKQDIEGLIPSTPLTDTSKRTLRGLTVLDLKVPNILNPRGVRKDTIGLLDCPSGEHRLALLGGAPGFLSHMVRDNCKPDIKTFTMMLDMVPSTAQAEGDLLILLHKHRLKPCTDFFNMMIRKRNLRHNYEEAKEVLKMMAKSAVPPNIQTFGCLAIGCYKKNDGLQLLRDIKNADFIPNVEIFGTLIHRAGQDWEYKIHLCKIMSSLQVKPNKLLLRHIETHRQRAYRAIIDQEKGLRVEPNMYGDRFKDNFYTFMKFYRSWLTDMELEEEMHPYRQFEQPHPETVARQQEEADSETFSEMKFVV